VKLLDSNGSANYLVPLSSGVLRPPHVKRIGPALALFAKLEDLVTAGSGTDGIVSRGKPITDRELGAALGLHQKTISEHRLRLSDHGYIEVKRTPHGHVIRVRKSKKWALIQQRRNNPKAKKEKEPSGSISSEVMEPIPPVIEPFGSSDRATRLHVDQTVVGLIQDVVGAAATSAKDPWKEIGLNFPLGTPDFQSSWEFFSRHRNGAPLSEAMERCIQARQKKNQSVPGPFFTAKRAVEELEKTQPLQEPSPIRNLSEEGVPA
jgi:DNA-binding transcriptional ArsR family regulator